MWVDYDVPNWFLTSKYFYRSPFSKWSPQYHTNSTLSDFKGSFNLFFKPFWKWRPVEIFQFRDIIIYPHIKFWWYRTMLNFCSIVVAILKMATSTNFSMSGINSGHHYPISKVALIYFLNRLSVAGLGDFIIVRL
jgi:hypothetical protein